MEVKTHMCPKTSKFGLKFAFLLGLAGSFGAVLVDVCSIDIASTDFLLFVNRAESTSSEVIVNLERG